MNPLDQFAKGAKKFSLSSLYGRIALILYNGTSDKAALAESDGKLIASLYGKVGSTSTAIALDTNGEHKVSNYGKVGSTLTAFALDDNGEQKVSLYSNTSAGAPIANRADAAGFQRVREFEPYEGSPDVVAIQTTATTIYTVPASTTSVVEIELANTDTVLNTYDFHIIPSGGSAVAGNVMRKTGSLGVGEAHRLGPFNVDAGVFFQALVTTVGGANGDINAIAIVKEYGTGDAVALV